MLKAVTHDGETQYFWTEETLTADHGVRLLGALHAKFGKKLVVCWIKPRTSTRRMSENS